jgi:hypothetical protein
MTIPHNLACMLARQFGWTWTYLNGDKLALNVFIDGALKHTVTRPEFAALVSAEEKRRGVQPHRAKV